MAEFAERNGPRYPAGGTSIFVAVSRRGALSSPKSPACSTCPSGARARAHARLISYLPVIVCKSVPFVESNWPFSDVWRDNRENDRPRTAYPPRGFPSECRIAKCTRALKPPGLSPFKFDPSSRKVRWCSCCLGYAGISLSSEHVLLLLSISISCWNAMIVVDQCTRDDRRGDLSPSTSDPAWYQAGPQSRWVLLSITSRSILENCATSLLAIVFIRKRNNSWSRDRYRNGRCTKLRTQPNGGVSPRGCKRFIVLAEKTG